MKKLSRLTALLLAIVMLLSTTAIAEDGFPQSEFDLQRYNQMHTDVQQRGLVDSAYEHYVQELAGLDTAARYAKLVSWHDSGLLGDIFYSSFVNYYKTAHPNGTLICTCASPLPYGGEGHADGCPWKPVAGTELKDEASGVSVVGEIPAGVELSVETASVNDILALEGLPEIEKEAIAGITNKHKVLDISMLMDETTEWQPYSENSDAVYVTMNVSDILNDSDDDVLLYHFHENEDGTVEKQVMGPFKADENGNIRVEMEKFSFVMVLNSSTKIKDVAVFYKAEVIENGKAVYPTSTNDHFIVIGAYYESDYDAEGKLVQGDLHVLIGTDKTESQAAGKFSIVSVDEKVSFNFTTDMDKDRYDVYPYKVTEIINEETGEVLAGSIPGVACVFDFNLGHYSLGREFSIDVIPPSGNGWRVDGLAVPLVLDYEIIKTVAKGTSADATFDDTVTVERGDWVIFKINVNNKGERELQDMLVQDTLPADVFDLTTVQMSIDGENGAVGNWVPFNQTLFNDYDSPGKKERLLYIMAQVKPDLGISADTPYTNMATIDGMNMPTYEDTATVIVKAPTEATLTVKKAITVENPNDTIPADASFEFTVVDVNGKVYTFNLGNNGTYEIPNFPKGAYTVKETPVNGYDTTISGPTGGTVTGTTYAGTMDPLKPPVIAFENKKGMETGSLKVSKAVIGIDAPAEDTFTFSVVFTGKGLPNAFSYTKSVDTIADVVWTVVDTDDVDTLTGTLVLKKNENVVFNNLPTNIRYTVTEAAKTGYTADEEEKFGTIAASESVAAFTNSYNFGSLEISKTVTGAPDNWPAETFEFKIKLSDETLTGTYSEVEFNQGVATVQLQGGHSKKISGLPKDATYTVTETPNAAYKTTVNGNETNVATGTISNTATATAAFNNELRVGTLNITKTVRQSDFNGGSFAFEVLDASDKVVAAGDSTSIALTADNKTDSIAAPITLVAGEYTVKELTTDGYNTTMQIDSEDAAPVTEIQVTIEPGERTTVNVVNTATGNTNVTATKVWADNNDELRLRPEALTLKVSGNNKEYEASRYTVDANDKNKWLYTFEVPKYDADGNVITYTADEANVPENYQKTKNGLTVTNTLTAGKLMINKTVKKEDYVEETFTFTVGTAAYTITVPAKAGSTVHTGSLENAIVLPAGTYTVTETGAANYSTTMQIDSADAASVTEIQVIIKPGELTTVNVVNTASEEIVLSVRKDWEDNENMWNLRPESVSIQLNGKVGETAFTHGKDALTLTADDGWNGSWQNVPKYDGEGRLITYTVTEDTVEKYTSSVTDNVAPEFVVTNTLNTYDLTITKAGLDLNLDPHSSTMYQVVGENGIAVDMTVAIHGNGSVTIKNLPQGTYTVNELTDWSWRYSSSSNRANNQVDVDGTDDTITFTNTRNEIYWLDSDCYAENRFTGSGAVATINPTK